MAHTNCIKSYVQVNNGGNIGGGAEEEKVDNIINGTGATPPLYGEQHLLPKLTTIDEDAKWGNRSSNHNP